MKDEPFRTCLGCRRAKPKHQLVRLVSDSAGVVTVDRTGRAAGRGAYVCTEAACMERALKAARLTYAFRKRCDARTDLAAEIRAAQRSTSGRSGEILS